jgi:serpin B
MSAKLTRRSFLSTAAALTAAAASRRAVARTPPPQPDQMSAGNTAFALDLYGQLDGTKGNLFFSPFSISTALAMTEAGAKGETRARMRNVLRLDGPAGSHLAGVLKQVNGEPGAKRGFELSVANAVWGQKGYPWRPEFLKTVREGYGADVKDADFKADPEAARKAINVWVEDKTRDKIKELFKPGVIDPLTRMVLANAVYFKGTWEKQFDKGATKDAPFTLADGSKKDVPLMAVTGRYRITETDDSQTIDLPYAGGQTSMVVVLPRKPDGLPAVEKALTADKLAVSPQAPAASVRVFLPRFKVEQAVNLNDPLKALGMTTPFDPEKADFTGMVTQTPEGPLYISAVVHKAFVDVNEEGTEAAAATGVVVAVRSAPAEPTVFRADHPFLFAIRHNPTGAVLFLGRYETP